MRQDIIISIRHEFAENIYAGEKTYELRKHQPNAPMGTWCWIYEPTPVGKITGFFSYGGCLKEEKGEMLNSLEDSLGLPSRQYFHDYYSKDYYAHAWVILTPARLSVPLPLDLIGLQQAPQSYIFFNGEVLDFHARPSEYQKAVQSYFFNYDAVPEHERMGYIREATEKFRVLLLEEFRNQKIIVK